MGKKLDKLVSRIEALEKALAALVTGKKPAKGKTKKKAAKAKPAKKPAKKTKAKAPIAPVIGNL